MLLNQEEEHIILPQAKLRYIKHFYKETVADALFHQLRKEIDWKIYKIKVFGMEYNQPRLTAFYDDSGIGYSYSNINLKAKNFTRILKSICNDIYTCTGLKFNSVLLNLYRSGDDSNGWHSDSEKELGSNPIIASLSLGEQRYFHIKHNVKQDIKYKILLGNGSLLIMEGEMQHHWKHQIAKTKIEVGERINLTFRQLKAI